MQNSSLRNRNRAFIQRMRKAGNLGEERGKIFLDRERVTYAKIL